MAIALALFGTAGARAADFGLRSLGSSTLQSALRLDPQHSIWEEDRLRLRGLVLRKSSTLLLDSVAVKLRAWDEGLGGAPFEIVVPARAQRTPFTLTVVSARGVVSSQNLELVAAIWPPPPPPHWAWFADLDLGSSVMKYTESNASVASGSTFAWMDELGLALELRLLRVRLTQLPHWEAILDLGASWPTPVGGTSPPLELGAELRLGRASMLHGPWGSRISLDLDLDYDRLPLYAPAVALDPATQTFITSPQTCTLSLLSGGVSLRFAGVNSRSWSLWFTAAHTLSGSSSVTNSGLVAAGSFSGWRFALAGRKSLGKRFFAHPGLRLDTLSGDSAVSGWGGFFALGIELR